MLGVWLGTGERLTVGHPTFFQTFAVLSGSTRFGTADTVVSVGSVESENRGESGAVRGGVPVWWWGCMGDTAKNACLELFE